MMGWYGDGMGRLGWVATGVFWVFMIGLIVWLVSRLLPGSSDGSGGPIGDSAMEILNGRLAEGEIDLTAWQAQRAALVAPADGSTHRSRDVR